MHAPSQPSWIPFSPSRPVVARPSMRRARMRLAVSTLGISLLLAASVIWLIVQYL